MKKYLMLPLVSLFFFISVPSVSAQELCKEKSRYINSDWIHNKACNSFNDLEVCEYSLGIGRRYASGSSEQFKKEASKRNLSNTDCRVMAGLESKNEKKVVNSNKYGYLKLSDDPSICNHYINTITHLKNNEFNKAVINEYQSRNLSNTDCRVNADTAEQKEQLVTPIIKPELKIKTKSESITSNKEIMVAIEVEPQLARIGEAEFGFKCEWMHWNSKGSASYNACIDTYVNADKAEQEELRLAKVEAENLAQEAKLLEDKMNELDRMYGATCKAMGLSKKDDEFPKCMMEMMKIEQEKEQAKIQNEIAMAQIQLQQAQLEAQNKAMDLRLAELEKNNELIREANIRSQKAEAERNRQQQVLLKKQIALQEKKDKQQGWMNALMALNALQPKQPSVGFIQTMPTRTICSWQYGQYVCNTR